MQFSRSQLSHFLILRTYSFFSLNEEHFTFHLQYKHSGTFANRVYEGFSYPQVPKMCDPILETVLKMRPHYSQSSLENASSFSGTSPLASYKEVPPSLGGGTCGLIVKIFRVAEKENAEVIWNT